MSLEFHNVTFSYGRRDILKDFSYVFPDCGVVCLFGPSGCGKTTILRIVSGLTEVTDGEVKGLPQMPSVMFQDNRLLPWKTAEENIDFVGTNGRYWIEKVGLLDSREKYPRELSGGMQRRVALARALSTDFDMLLLDEPFTGLEDELIEEFAKIIKEIAKEKLVIMVTHKKEEAQLLGASILEMRMAGE